ncbi:MAG TPA: hypothetical protein VEC01_16970 [Noviherbaspirillum sp.]|uniref:hypothetical protein n=1 Tax=Noviherbaspirillum sp. TaxID=1926288 RepID=UPI002D31CE0D|nr:hypothetical protein [Noviherbaspirillum sp.]HYD97024.1 hypothetical protein [Noviherbaspirillum sp.]
MTDAILGNGPLYERLCVVAEVLGKFVSCSPRAVDIAQLERHTGRTARELFRLCAMLCREQLLRPAPGLAQSWLLACPAGTLTLEDAFRCVLAEQAARGRRATAKPAMPDAPRRDVDLLVMQAAMGINQSVLRHLRQFSLDRLTLRAPAARGHRRAEPDAWACARLSFS